MKDEEKRTKAEGLAMTGNRASAHPSSFILHPSSRAWFTVAWALALAAALAAWDAGERWLAAQVDRPVVLLPKRPLDDAARTAAARKLAGDPAVASAVWRSPDSLNQQLRATLSAPGWSGLFPEDNAWVPWILEIRLADPLAHAAAARAFVDECRQSGTWRLVLWDGTALTRLAGWRRIWRGTLGLWATLLLVVGAVGLARLPSEPAGGWIEWTWTTVLSLAAVTAVWAMVPILGGPADGRALGLGWVAAFLLAGLVAPMLRVRQSSSTMPRASAVSILMKEASDERPSPRPGQ